MLGNELDARVQCFLKALRANGAFINAAIVMATAEGIVRHYESNLLVKNGGSIAIIKFWASSMMTQMNFMKRHGNSKAKVTVTNFNVLRSSSSLMSK